MINKTVSVVLGSFNRKHFLGRAIESVRSELQMIEGKSEIIVVDGGSADGSMEWLVRQKDIILIVQHNRGVWLGKAIERRSWGYFMNLGFKCAQGKYVCMISDDCLLIPGSIVNACNLFEKELKKGKKIGSVAFYFRDWPFARDYHVNINFGKVYLNHGLYLKKALEEVGYANEDDYRFYGADIDLGMKMFDKGYVCLVSERSFVEHFSDANNLIRNTNIDVARNDADVLRKKWENKYGELGGEWKEKVFDDPSKIAYEFRLLLILEYINQFSQSPVKFIKRIIEFFNKRIRNDKK